MLNHVERFLKGKVYRLDEEGIENMLNMVKEQKGNETYEKAKQSLTKEFDNKGSMADIRFYLVSVNMN